MGIKTGIIKYNLADRLRKHRGQERTFDLVAAERLLNGAAVQERIKHGDMTGYFGHWPRVQFGLDPVEGGFVNGKQVSLEPALRTTYLKAHPDGTVEHEVEFLDTDSGKIAQRIYGSKAYGFSSAIDTKRLGSVQVPIGFFGFDFVKEPNFSANRGYAVALDGVFDSEDVLDAVSERNAMFEAMNVVLDDAQGALERTQATLDRVLQENEELYSMLAKRDRAPTEVALDGCMDLIGGSKRSRLDRADEFLDLELVGFEKPERGPSPSKVADKAINRHFR
ncbi:hypothetical protein [Stutzerimonas nitrititolerans]|uniref:hypothetical protein n=1 Tax=Stutzerimonas nitrititolerans TaxID=2482751 RepID=UPI0028A886FE|nr:hypothetical protein [Stutzerimonas nitrititolerans]